jgi:transposase
MLLPSIDLAKNVFQLAYADSNWKIVSTPRLTRSQFHRCFQNSSISLVIMEACGCAHYWARQIQTHGIEVRLLPARYIRAYVKRNKTDAADAAALLEAARCGDIQPVRIKSVEQQATYSSHLRCRIYDCKRTPVANNRSVSTYGRSPYMFCYA